MNFKVKREFIDALLECQAISDKGSRDTVVNQLPPNIRHKIYENSASKFHVTNIVHACWNYSDGIEELIEIVRYFEGDSIPMQKVDKVWSRLSKPHVATLEQREQLLAIVEKAALPKQKLNALYESALPTEPSVPYKEELRSMLEQLWNIHLQPDGTRPILIFVERLAHHLNGSSVADELRTWTDEIAPFLGVQDEKIEEWRAKIQNEPPPKPQPNWCRSYEQLGRCCQAKVLSANVCLGGIKCP